MDETRRRDARRRDRTLLIVGALALAGSAVYAAQMVADAGAPAAAVRLDLPPAHVRDLRLTDDCALGSGCANCVDCTCEPGEIAIGGGGQCPEQRALIESGNRYRTSNTDRFLEVWRVSCAGVMPQRTTAVCATLVAF